VTLIQARGLTKYFSGKAAVKDLSFDVVPGSVTGFLGPNGAGKSTTMRLMLGLDNGAGLTTYDGVAYRDLREPLRQVGSVLDAKPFHPTRKAENHLRMLAASQRIPNSRVTEVINIVGLGEVARAKPKTFSLGMGQRLGLAAALLGDPGTLILDEPANGLDPQGVHWLRTMLKMLAGQGRSIFVSSHLLSEMALMADNLVVVGRGSLIASGPIADFIATSRRNAVVVRVDDPARLTSALVSLGGQVTPEAAGQLAVTGVTSEQVSDVLFDLRLKVFELTNREPTLEEAFLDATGASEEFRASMGLGAYADQAPSQQLPAAWPPAPPAAWPPVPPEGPPAMPPTPIPPPPPPPGPDGGPA
jgi:ABC-2 type transport system ATP-binding protein